MSESEWSKILGWPGYRVYRSEINEEAKTLRLWVRRKRGNRKLECSGCGRRINEIAEIYEREVRDLRVCSRIRSLKRAMALGAIRRLGSRSPVKLNPRNFLCPGRATALFA